MQEQPVLVLDGSSTAVTVTSPSCKKTAAASHSCAVLIVSPPASSHSAPNTVE